MGLCDPRGHLSCHPSQAQPCRDSAGDGHRLRSSLAERLLAAAIASPARTFPIVSDASNPQLARLDRTTPPFALGTADASPLAGGDSLGQAARRPHSPWVPTPPDLFATHLGALAAPSHSGTPRTCV